MGVDKNVSKHRRHSNELRNVFEREKKVKVRRSLNMGLIERFLELVQETRTLANILWLRASARSIRQL